MKPISLLFIALVAILFQGCIIKSLYPFYKESDLVFKQELVNTSWVDQDGAQWVINVVKERPNAYEMHYLGKEKDRDVVFVAHLFKLNNNLYLDFFPVSDGNETSAIFNLHLLPTHSLAKVNVMNNAEIQIKWFNEEWLRSLFEQNRIKISHEVIYDEDPRDKDKMYVLTAPVDELQKFVIKYGDWDAAFDNDNSVWLRLKKANQ